jgi:ribonucleotide monophosphatase NagD (HAD superfamily)
MTKTIFCDIDGTLIKFKEKFNSILDKAEALEYSAETTMQWHRKGYKIILVTGRTEPFRKRTQEQLEESGIIYDQLIMGAGSGERYLINDRTDKLEPTAFSINVERDEGIFPDILKSKTIKGPVAAFTPRKARLLEEEYEPKNSKPVRFKGKDF